MKIRFADCTLDIDARRLFRGPREVHLSPKGFGLLKLVIESRPKALSKNELVERVWSGVFVSDASLAKVVSKVRAAIGDDDDAAPMIRTVHGYGYAFAADVVDESRSDTAVASAPAICWLFCGTREFPLHDGEHIVGREPDCSVWLDSPKVSRRHAKIVVNGRSATFEDLGSKNGSYVRGVLVSGVTTLESGDDARIGPFTLIMRIGPSSGSTQTEAR